MTMVTGMCRAHPHLYRAAFKEITTCSKGQGGACSGPRPECRLVRGVDSPAPAITQALKTTTLAAPTWQHPHIPYLAPWPSSFCVARKERQRETLWGFTLPETKKKKGPNMVEKKQEKIKEKITDRRHGVMLVSHPRQQVASGARTSPLTESSAGALGPCLQAVRA